MRAVASTTDEVAAADLGSNSFHMIVARLHRGQLRVVDRLREPVRLAAGLDEDRQLTREARERALACLEKFGQRIEHLPAGSVRAVGTNTLRRARNSRGFLHAARQTFGHSIEIVSGFEEARLIYLGVAHSLAAGEGNRLVIDIGGGSTEVIVGARFEPHLMDSLHMGCVGLTQHYFPAGKITRKRLGRAILAARVELEPVKAGFRRLGWAHAVGASGTVRAIERAVREAGWSHYGITAESLHRLGKALAAAGHVDRIRLAGVSRDRAQVIPGGLAMLTAAFESLGIEHMKAADGALREGVLYDLLGRIRHEDVRDYSVSALALRYHVDEAQAERVGDTARVLLSEVAADWQLTGEDTRLLGWAVQLHEVGLDISHSQYHKHGEYLITHADLAGFASEEQRSLALLVRAHRRKFPRALMDKLPAVRAKRVRRLAVLLRLAILLHRSRNPRTLPSLKLAAAGNRLRCDIPPEWLAAHPLVEADLAQEADYLQAGGLKLEVRHSTPGETGSWGHPHSGA